MSGHILAVAASSQWISGVQTTSQIRNFSPVLMDEPKALGGADEGPNPLEYLVASLIDCKGVMLPLLSKEPGLRLSDLSFATDDVIHLRGLMGQKRISTHYQTLTFVVNIKTDESHKRLQERQEAVSTRCT